MKKMAQRLRKGETRLGKKLTVAKMRRCGFSCLVWISSAFYGSARTTARPRVRVGSSVGLMVLFKAPLA